VKRRLVVEATGGPRGATSAGANVHDTKLLAATLVTADDRILTWSGTLQRHDARQCERP
jgi:hypothetical protein